MAPASEADYHRHRVCLFSIVILVGNESKLWVLMPEKRSGIRSEMHIASFHSIISLLLLLDFFLHLGSLTTGRKAIH